MKHPEKNPYKEPNLGMRSESRQGSGRLRLIIRGTLWVAVAIVCSGLMIPAVFRDITPTRHRMECSHNLKQIGAALRAYRSDYGVFPPISTLDTEGRPLHSWRVLILPYLGEKVLYDRIVLSQPWDGPVHQALHTQCPKIYQCPRARLKKGDTNYLAIADSKAWNQKDEPATNELGQTMSLFKDVLIMESTREEAIHWMNPNDPEWSKHGLAKPNSGKKQVHEGMTHVLLVDGSTHVVSEDSIDSLLRNQASD